MFLSGRVRFCRVALAWLAVLIAAAPSLAKEPDLKVEATEWGFDGKAVRETFTPLHVLVKNTTAKPVSGKLRLSRDVALGGVLEPPFEIPLEIPAADTRWVQLAGYTVDEFAPWILTWGSAKDEQLELASPRIGDPAAVLLTNPGDRPIPSGAIKRFKANLFPASVTFTDGLGAVFLDSVPDLQGARLQAFLEWLSRGGRVILLHNEQGTFARFPSALGMLNDPSDNFPVGAGRVQRASLQAREVGEAQLWKLSGRPTPPKKLQNDPASVWADPMRVYNGAVPWNPDRRVLEQLEEVSRFTRRWWIIYPLCLLYLAAVFPGSFVIARGTPAVRWFYFFYIGTAVLFSFAFKWLGGVGGGEKNRVRSATVAAQITPGVFDVSQWNCLAAVDGGWFTLTHDGSGRADAAYEELDSVHGLVTFGSDAKFEVDIPVASTRSVVSRFRATAAPVSAEIRGIEFLDDRLTSCNIAFQGLPKKPIEAYVSYGPSTLRLTEFGDAWATDRRKATPTSVFIASLDTIETYSFRPKPKKERILDDDFYRSLQRVLVGNAFRIRNDIRPESATLPSGIIRAMALVDDGSAFASKVDGFDDHQGCVLYVIDIPTEQNR